MAGIDIQIKGLRDLTRNLQRVGRDLVASAGPALYEEAQVEKLESMRRTPVDTGALRASHDVSQPQTQGRDVSVTISVGGPSAPYAEVVHENMEALHATGQAKFLESTVREAVPHLAARIARRMAAALRG
jgi:hypothetical protein